MGSWRAGCGGSRTSGSGCGPGKRTSRDAGTAPRPDLTEDGLTDCTVERRAFGDIAPDQCGSLLPTLVLVEATGRTGTAFILELQVSDGVRAPVVAVTAGGELMS